MFLIFFLSFSSLVTASEKYEDVVYLKNGSVIHGLIIEMIPTEYIKINSNGNIFKYTMSEIQKIEKEEVSQALNFNFYHEIKKNKRIESVFTVGFGLSGAPGLGVVNKNRLGFPISEYGITDLIGFSYTWVKGGPSNDDITTSAFFVEQNYTISDSKQFKELIFDELKSRYKIKYFSIGLCMIPPNFNLEWGRMFILSPNARARIGFGFPTLLTFGINYDFG